MNDLGPIGRLGHWTATHFRAVAIGWVLIAVGFGFLAPRVENALSGAGWEATGSDSVEARDLIDAEFDGLGADGLMVVVSSDDPGPRRSRVRADDRQRRRKLAADER